MYNVKAWVVSLQGTLIKHIHDYFYFFLLSSTSYYYSTLATLTSSRPKENFFVNILHWVFLNWLSCDLDTCWITLGYAENKLSQGILFGKCHKTYSKDSSFRLKYHRMLIPDIWLSRNSQWWQGSQKSVNAWYFFICIPYFLW